MSVMSNATHPGFQIAELMKKYNIQMEKDLATLLEISTPRCNRLLQGKMSLTVDTAIRLATCFPAERSSVEWLALQSAYDIRRLKQDEKIKLSLRRLKRRALLPDTQQDAAQAVA